MRRGAEPCPEATAMKSQRSIQIRAATLAFAALPTLLQIAQAQQPEQRSQRSFTVSAGSTLKVDNYKGTIHVAGSDANQVVVNLLTRFEAGSASYRKCSTY